jgi:hypothetical protein
MAEEPNYSPEVIRRYREMEGRNAFKREVKERVTVNLEKDRVTFACGHQEEVPYGMLEAAANLARAKGIDDGSPVMLLCRECRSAWLKKAAAEGATES